MNNYKLIIFDLDGTLADTSPGILNSIRYARKMMNLPEITLEQMYSHVGPPMDESYARNFGLSGDRLRQAVEYHKEYAVKQGYKEIELYPHITDLLDKLKAQGKLTAVATLKAHQTAVKIFDTFGLSDKFDIVTGVDTKAPKTKAQLLEYCLEKSGCDKSQAVLIGDSKYDAIGAKEAGIDFIAVTYGFGFKTEDDAKEFPCCAVCEDVIQIEKFLCE